jgi:hypothetical protein
VNCHIVSTPRSNRTPGGALTEHHEISIDNDDAPILIGNGPTKKTALQDAMNTLQMLQSDIARRLDDIEREHPDYKEEWRQRARRWVNRESQINTAGPFTDLIEEARLLIRAAYHIPP